MSFLMERYLSSYDDNLETSDASPFANSSNKTFTSSRKSMSRKFNSPKEIIDGAKRERQDAGSLETVEKESDGNGDDKSESGTYTLDKDDPEVEEARRRIDQVFGVARDFTLPQSTSCDRVSLNTSLANHRPAISSSKTDGELSTRNSPLFPRARLSQGIRQQIPINPNFLKSRRANLSLPGSNAGSDSDSNGNSPAHTRQVYIGNTNCNRLASPLHSPRRQSQDLGTDKEQNNIKSRPPNLRARSEKGSRTSLNDFDDDASLKSDAASTESTGSNSGKCNSDVNHSSLPPMRLNRTVALRRAKLGKDTLGVPLNLTPKPVSTPLSSQQPFRANFRPSSSSSPTAFTRNDGGRFSLRLSAKSSGRRPPTSQPEITSAKLHPSNSVVNKLKPIARSRPAISDNECSNRCRSPSQSNTNASQPTRKISLMKSSSFHDPKENSDLVREPNNYRQMSPFQVSKRIFSSKPHQMLNRDNAMKSLSSHHTSSQYSQIDNRTKENLAAAERLQETIRSNVFEDDKKHSSGLSPLDKVVIAAILQLSHKLRHSLRFILEDERLRYPPESETRIMIEELSPQIAVQDRKAPESADKSKDLLNILKNLKKIEQSFELVSLLLKNRNIDISSTEEETTSGVSSYQDEY